MVAGLAGAPGLSAHGAVAWVCRAPSGSAHSPRECWAQGGTEAPEQNQQIAGSAVSSTHYLLFLYWLSPEHLSHLESFQEVTPLQRGKH